MTYFTSEEILTALTMLGIVAAVLLFQFYRRSSGLSVLEQLLREYYSEEGIEILSISKLKMADKLKYGILVSPFVSLYTSAFRFFLPSPESHYRLVETKDASGKEHLRYVEITFKSKTGMSVKEFDSYEF